ncbi:hypothetical protein POVWA2_050150 [Plasmodium ovale wallikeri]|uniref:Uncharacterized protein n=1 Tax=Plasmodium ovale wallikeri TaxID=864142 RepID=A0A1A8ZNT9_PLAOA|nr:hypothetical protein POVWA1_001260 [Plasmodium ovale wallikeri]SBT45531.1 hypothetical protein POVWA2_050150 [Plasmodium ovale wallikeri]
MDGLVEGCASEYSPTCTCAKAELSYGKKSPFEDVLLGCSAAKPFHAPTQRNVLTLLEGSPRNEELELK